LVTWIPPPLLGVALFEIVELETVAVVVRYMPPPRPPAARRWPSMVVPVTVRVLGSTFRAPRLLASDAMPPPWVAFVWPPGSPLLIVVLLMVAVGVSPASSGPVKMAPPIPVTRLDAFVDWIARLAPKVEPDTVRDPALTMAPPLPALSAAPPLAMFPVSDAPATFTMAPGPARLTPLISAAFVPKP
jgi:hypothetical protein